MTAGHLEPPVGSEGRALLRRIRIFANEYPVEQEMGLRAVHDMAARGFIQRHGKGRSLLRLTAKGEMHLDGIMRCE
jgi:hypothetical protein